MRKELEAKHQQDIILFMNKNYFKTHIIFSVPNEIPYPLPPKIMVEILSKLQQNGLLKGASDLVILCPDKRYITVEVKTSTGSQSKEQIIFENRVTEIKGDYIVVRSLEDFIKKVVPIL
jgi:hypothetical protein